MPLLKTYSVWLQAAFSPPLYPPIVIYFLTHLEPSCLTGPTNILYVHVHSHLSMLTIPFLCGITLFRPTFPLSCGFNFEKCFHWPPCTIMGLISIWSLIFRDQASLNLCSQWVAGVCSHWKCMVNWITKKGGRLDSLEAPAELYWTGPEAHSLMSKFHLYPGYFGGWVGRE